MKNDVSLTREGRESWEEVIDFIKIQKRGVALVDLLSRLEMKKTKNEFYE